MSSKYAHKGEARRPPTTQDSHNVKEKNAIDDPETIQQPKGNNDSKVYSVLPALGTLFLFWQFITHYSTSNYKIIRNGRQL